MKHYPTDYYRDKMASSQKSKGKGEMVRKPLHKPGSESVKGIKGGFKSTHCRSETFTVRSRSFKMTVIYCQQNPETRYFLEFYRLKYPTICVIYSSMRHNTRWIWIAVEHRHGGLEWCGHAAGAERIDGVQLNESWHTIEFPGACHAGNPGEVVGWEGVIKICGLSLR